MSLAAKCVILRRFDKMKDNKKINGILSLSPLVAFLAIYVVSSLVAGDFYGVPVSAVFLLACILAVAISKGSISDRMKTFARGAGKPKVMLMIWIFILAGAFAGTAKDIGSVEATVNAALHLLPPKMLLAGLFLTSCFISMAIGTSVGTIVALMPLGAGIAAQTGVETALMAGVVVGGAFFGDNLSFISDTTIASTRAAGCEMKDKFRTNIWIVLPAVVVVAAIYIWLGRDVSLVAEAGDVNIVKVLPYLLIIVLALAGCDVLLLLSIGIAAIAVTGWCFGDFGWTGWLESVGGGIAGMSDLIIVTLLAGGLLEVIRENGGLDVVISLLTRRVHGRKGAQASIAALVCLANVCTANNTIAIITVGDIARDIAERFGIAPRKTASLLDTFSCFTQGLIPYGAQLLMASGLCGISPTAIIPFLFYPFVMGICAVGSILLDLPKVSD